MRRFSCRLPVLSIISIAVVLATYSAAAQTQPLTLAGDLPPATTVGSDYRFNFRVSGGSQSYLWNLAPNSQLPTGFKLNQQDGRLSGTPTAPGEYRFTVVVADINDHTVQV